MEHLRQSAEIIRQNEQERASFLFAHAFLNELNIEIQKKQRKDGKSFVSRTTLESVYFQQETVVFRAVPFHPMTSEEVLTEILAEQVLLGSQLGQRQWKKWKHNAPTNFEECFDLSEFKPTAPNSKPVC